MKWNGVRRHVGRYPPDGWPLQCVMMMIAAFTIFVTVMKGHKKNKLCKQVNEAQAYQSQDKNKGAKSRS